MANIKIGFKAFINILMLVLLFCIPGTGILFCLFFFDRKNFVGVLVGNAWLISYIKKLRSNREPRES